MAAHKRRTNEEIINAYRETGSVWRAGKSLGMAGQSVHERLVALEYPLANRKWTTEEIEELTNLVGEGLTLGEVARRLGRPFGGVAMKSSRLGLTAQKKPSEKKLPRGAGYDKATTLRRLRELVNFDGSVTQYARSIGANVDSLVGAFQRHYPLEWESYVRGRSDIPEKTCPYCEESFVPSSGRQQFCTRKCADDSRRDEAYFGGKRRQAAGMAAGVCQLCGRKVEKGLSAHHVLGKDNDDDNDSLVALCRGCHKIVGLLGARTFVDDPAAWETLISLAWFRRHGHELDALDGDTLHVTVDVETYFDPADESEEPAEQLALGVAA